MKQTAICDTCKKTAVIMWGRLSALVAAAMVSMASNAIVVYTDPDGTTFDVSGGVLAITTPAAVTNSYNYSALLTGITNIVKTGSGVLVATPVPAYTGDWHIEQGEYHFSNAVGVFGMQGVQNGTSNGRVFVASGASIRAVTGGTVTYEVLKYKDIYIAGAGTGQFGAKGAIVGVTGSGDQTLSYARMHLVDDATFYQPNRPLKFNQCTIDTAGNDFTLSTAGGGGRVYVVGSSVITNSSDTPSTMNLHASSTKYYIGPATWTGGPKNTIDCRSTLFPLYLLSACTADWTLLLGNGGKVGGSTGQGPGKTTFSWDGPIVFSGETIFSGSGSVEAGATVTLKGALSGIGDASWKLTGGFSLNIMTAENTFGGAVSMNNTNGGSYRTRIQLYSGAVFSAKSLAVDSSDFYMADDTAFRIPAVSHSAGDSLFTGGAAGTTIDLITKSGTGTLTLNTPATVIGGIKVDGGTVALGTTAPVVPELAFASGTTLDLNGKTLTVGTLTGYPTLSNPGALVVTGRWSMAVGAAPEVWNSNIFVPASGRIRVSALSGNLPVGETVVMYFPGGATPPDVSRFYGVAEAGSGVAFEYRAVADGDYAGYTALVATVTAGVASATWSATSAGGSYETAANWQSAANPANGASVTFPAAAVAGVAVTKAADSSVSGIAFGAGAGSSSMAEDWYSGFGYSIGGSGAILIGADTSVVSSGGGVNTISAPVVGAGTLEINTALYPLTNTANAVYSRTVLAENALAGFSGLVKANVTLAVPTGWLAGYTELHTGRFAGQLEVGYGETSVDSLAFVKRAQDLVLRSYGTLAYTGPDAEIAGLTWMASAPFAICNVHDLTVGTISAEASGGALTKSGAGTLALHGTRAMTFGGGADGNGIDYGFPYENCAHGRPARSRYKSLNICDGTLKVGEPGDSANAPALQLNSMTLGQGYSETVAPRFQLDNGTVTVRDCIAMGYYVKPESESTKREFVVNGGTITAGGVYGARIGYRSMTSGSQTFEVNGGAFTLNGPFNLTQLSPGGDKASRRESMKHKLTLNGGECSCTIFRMGYSYGLSWDGSLGNNNGYGHGWQPDAYLTMNGGTMTVSEYLLAGDRNDSRSWTMLNGGVLKVNMLTNTYAGASVATDDGAVNFVFNGGTYAPTGDGDVPDELVMKRLTTAVVSTNGAVFSTAYLSVGATFTIEQSLTHDPLCGDEPDGGLTKIGAGTLALSGANTFTGPLRVEGGAVSVLKSDSLSKNKDVVLSNGGVINIANGVVLKFASLEIDGVQVPGGVYGGAESSADKRYAGRLTGSGSVQVGKPGAMLIVF